MESANAAPPERVCTVCVALPVARPWAVYTDEASHVTTELHLEAMADESVREWLALPSTHPDAIAFAKQIARMEHFYYSYDDWRRAMGLPDTPETLVISRRISAIWIRAIGEADYELRMAYARALIAVDLGMDEKGKKSR